MSLGVRGSILPVLALAVRGLCLPCEAAAADAIVYDNTENIAPYFWTPPVSAEVGDGVSLAGGGQTVTRFEFRYSGGFDMDGDETAQLRLYTADGPEGAPDALLYESAVIPVAPASSSGESVVIDGLSVEVPGDLVWTLELEGISQDSLDQVVLRLYDPPVVGSSDPDFVWLRSSPAVIWSKHSLPSGNLYAQIIAVPEPSALALQLAAGVTLGVLLALGERRRERTARPIVA